MTTEPIATIRQRWANLSELLYHERHDDEDARYIIDARLDDEDGTLILIDAPESHECYALELAADASRDVPALLAALDATARELAASRAYMRHALADPEDQTEEESWAWERKEVSLFREWRGIAHAAGTIPRNPVPLIVCLCGSTRFYTAFQEANYRETMAGNIVLTVGFYPHAADRAHGEEVGVTPEQKVALDELHKRKIDMCDEVFVLNVGGYIGESTRAEIEYTQRIGKLVRYLETNA